MFEFDFFNILFGLIGSPDAVDPGELAKLPAEVCTGEVGLRDVPAIFVFMAVEEQQPKVPITVSTLARLWYKLNLRWLRPILGDLSLLV